MKRLWYLVPLCIIMAITLVGCGGSATSTTSSTSTPTPTLAPTPTPTPATKTADQILQTMKASVSTIGTSFDYTAANDPNHLLGRPGQYISKTNWIDTGISTTDTDADISVSDGGSIETFASLTDANSRFAYIQQISKSAPIFNEYEYQQGQYILRISNTLTPDQAQAYDNAFKQAVS